MTPKTSSGRGRGRKANRLLHPDRRGRAGARADSPSLFLPLDSTVAEPYRPGARPPTVYQENGAANSASLAFRHVLGSARSGMYQRQPHGGTPGDISPGLLAVCRGFESLLIGKDPRDASQIMRRICGVCPTNHVMAACLAMEALAGFSAPDSARIIRNLILPARTHPVADIPDFYHLALPSCVSSKARRSQCHPGLRHTAATFDSVRPIGRGFGNLIAFGVFDLNAAGRRSCLPVVGRPTVVRGPVSRSRSDRRADELLLVLRLGAGPEPGHDHAEPGQGRRLFWLKAPRYGGVPYEGSALARIWVMAILRRGISVIDHHHVPGEGDEQDRARDAGNR